MHLLNSGQSLTDFGLWVSDHDLREGEVEKGQLWLRGQDGGNECGMGGALPIPRPRSSQRGCTASVEPLQGSSCPYQLLGGCRADVDVAAASMARGEVLYSVVSADRVEDGVRAQAVSAAGRRLRAYGV